MSPKYLFIVRRDRAEIWHVFREYFGESKVHVVWDRRHEERRRRCTQVVNERRQGERRGPPSSSWESLGYVLVRQRAEHATQ